MAKSIAFVPDINKTLRQLLDWMHNILICGDRDDISSLIPPNTVCDLNIVRVIAKFDICIKINAVKRLDRIFVCGIDYLSGVVVIAISKAEWELDRLIVVYRSVNLLHLDNVERVVK